MTPGNRHPSPRLTLLLEAPPARLLLRLATPNVITALTMSGVTFADAWFVGQLGIEALAALALVFPFQALMQMMAAGAVGGGIASATARALGAGNVDKAAELAWHAILIGLLLSLVYVLALGIMAQPLFAFFKVSNAVQENAVAYAQIVFGGATIMWLLQGFFAILRGSGDTINPARAIVTSSLIQIALSGALTLGWGPFPALGMRGPAVAMLLSLATAGIYLGWILMRPTTKNRVVRLRPYPIRWTPIKEIMAVGFLGLINSLTIALTVVAVTRLVTEFGTAALAGYGLGSRLELMLVPLAFGVGGALTGAVGANVGAGQYPRARRLAWSGALVTGSVTGTLGIIVAIWPELWLNFFTTNSDAFSMGALYLLIAGPFYGLFGAGQTLYFASQGTGHMTLPVTVGALRFLVAAGGGTLVVFLNGSIEILFICVSLGLAIIGIGTALCLKSRGWRSEEEIISAQKMHNSKLLD